MATLRSKLNLLCHPASQTLCQACNFQSGLTVNSTVHLYLSLCPLTCLYSFTVNHLPLLLCDSFPSFCPLCLQLPSPTAMSTALRGISCYLREVTAMTPLSVCVVNLLLSVPLSCLQGLVGGGGQNDHNHNLFCGLHTAQKPSHSSENKSHSSSVIYESLLQQVFSV